MTGNDISRWGDDAMFHAAPLKASDGPTVKLLSATADPLGQIAAACKVYKGEVVESLDDITDEERHEYLEQVRATKLKAPYEFVKFHFFVSGVTRAWTHQAVRQRTAAWAQESLRFAVKDDVAEGVALPPSIAGTTGQEAPGAEDNKAEYWRNIWDQAVEHLGQAYLHLVADGMPAEDARGLLPHNITTRLHYTTDLRALQDHAGNRLCTQAQFEWRVVWAQFLRAIREYSSAPSDEPEYPEERTSRLADNWQWREIAGLFRPVCYLTGKCEFKANFDRSCSIRDDVDRLGAAGIPTAHWDDEIKPGRWLLDVKSAGRRS